jgi:hypothetical protein
MYRIHTSFTPEITPMRHSRFRGRPGQIGEATAAEAFVGIGGLKKISLVKGAWLWKFPEAPVPQGIPGQIIDFHV